MPVVLFVLLASLAIYLSFEVIVMDVMEASENIVIAKWNELKSTLESIELDVAKNARGIAAAGVRVRKGLRALKTLASQLVKLTVDIDKDKRAVKPEKLAA